MVLDVEHHVRAHLGETPPEANEIIDVVVAPVIYRILFNNESAEDLDVRGRIAAVLGAGRN